MNLFAATKALLGGRTALAGAAAAALGALALANRAAVAGLGALFAAALFPGLFDHGLPHRPARAEAAPMAAAAAPGLYFHGPGGEFLDFAPAGQHHP